MQFIFNFPLYKTCREKHLVLSGIALSVASLANANCILHLLLGIECLVITKKETLIAIILDA